MYISEEFIEDIALPNEEYERELTLQTLMEENLALQAQSSSYLFPIPSSDYTNLSKDATHHHEGHHFLHKNGDPHSPSSNLTGVITGIRRGKSGVASPHNSDNYYSSSSVNNNNINNNNSSNYKYNNSSVSITGHVHKHLDSVVNKSMDKSNQVSQMNVVHSSQVLSLENNVKKVKKNNKIKHKKANNNKISHHKKHQKKRKKKKNDNKKKHKLERKHRNKRKRKHKSKHRQHHHPNRNNIAKMDQIHQTMNKITAKNNIADDNTSKDDNSLRSKTKSAALRRLKKHTKYQARRIMRSRERRAATARKVKKHKLIFFKYLFNHIVVTLTPSVGTGLQITDIYLVK